MTLQEAVNLASSVIQEKLDVLKPLEDRLSQKDLERYKRTVTQLLEAQRTLNDHYPPPLSVKVSDSIIIKDKFGFLNEQ